MNKKGSHVDWVISMGIFLIYIFALFILLRPGVRPVYKPTTLLDNLEENFREDVMWTVKKIPLFIRSCSGITPDNFPPEITIDDANNNWSLGNIARGDIDKTYSGKLICDDLNFIDAGGDSVAFYFYMYGEGVPKFEIRCTTIEEEDCIAELGVVEEINGIDESKLNLVYDAVKEDWGIPPGKEIAIFIDDFSGDRDKIVGGEPYEQANVFVRRMETQIVKKNGDTTPVAVYLQIW